MTIYRDGKAIELTGEEIAQVVKESHLDFYRDELRDSFYVPESKYDDIAERAYELYCEGDGKTEYECLEEAVDELGKYTFEIWQDGCCIHEDHYYENETEEDARADAEEYVNDLIEDQGGDFCDFEIKIFFNGEELSSYGID